MNGRSPSPIAAETPLVFPTADERDAASLEEACRSNGWLKRGGYAWQDDPSIGERPFASCRASDMEGLGAYLRQYPRPLRQGIVYRDLALIQQADFIKSVGRISSITVSNTAERPANSVTVLDNGLEIYLVLGDLVDLSAEVSRLEKELGKAQGELAGVEKTLANEGFVAKAAPDVIQAKRDRAVELTQTIEQLTAEIAGLK